VRSRPAGSLKRNGRCSRSPTPGNPDVCGGSLKVRPRKDAEREDQAGRRRHVQSRCKGAFAGERSAGDVRDIFREENQAVSHVTLDVPEQAPLDTGAEPVADDKDVDRDEEKDALEDENDGGVCRDYVGLMSGLSGFLSARTYSVALPFLPCFEENTPRAKIVRDPAGQSDQLYR
jgi:hypothetical protein